MKRIIVPTDFSELSNYGIDYAVSLAKQIKASVSVVHCENRPLGDLSLHTSGPAESEGATDSDLFEAQLFRSNYLKLNELSEKYSKEGVDLTCGQVGGGFLLGMKHYVERFGADLIVISTTGEESVQEFFSGNHTEQLIEHLNVPVLSLVNPAEAEIHNVVLGLDLTEESYSKRTLQAVHKILGDLPAVVHVVSVVSNGMQEHSITNLYAHAKAIGIKNFMVEVLISNKPNDALLDYAESIQAELIVTLSSADSGFKRFIQHSFAAKLTKTSSIPVLTINKRLIEAIEEQHQTETVTQKIKKDSAF